MVSLSQPVAIITGAGRGIGRATAVLLSSLGYACVLCARSIEELNVTAALCSSATRTIVCDVTQPQQIAGVVEQTLAAFERIDLLVNNAGIAPLVPFDQIDDDALAATIDVNLTGTLRFSRAVWNVMKRQGEGVIVNVSSESARDPFPGFAVYGAAKAGVNLLTRALAKEGQAAGIRVYAVAPSGVETSLLRSIVSAADYPPEQVLTPEEVAEAIVACATGSMRYAAGETIYIHKNA